MSNAENLNRAGSDARAAAVGPSRAPRARRRLRWLMTVVWAGFIFYLSTSGFGPSFTQWLLTQILSLLHVTVTPQTFEFLHFCLRKAAHMTEYCIFTLLIYASFLDADDFEWHPRLAVRSVVIAAVYSLTDEYHQSFVANRTPSLIDCGIDTTGAGFAILMIFVWDRLVQAFRSRRAAGVGGS